MAGEGGARLHFISADKPERTERKEKVQCTFLVRGQPAGQYDRRLHKKRLPGGEPFFVEPEGVEPSSR